MNPKAYNINCVSVQMQQFDIDTKQGRRKDYIWGVGVRSTLPLQILGSRINPIWGYHYFPILKKVSYISDAGMFEAYLGIRVNFFAKK